MDEFETPPLCRRIREARERVGLSQEEAARLLHMSLGGYAAYERSREPRPARAREIAAAFGLEPDYFERAEAPSDSVTELLRALRPGPETENLGPLTVDEIRGRFEGLGYIIREQAPDLRPLQDALAALAAQVAALVALLEQRDRPQDDRTEQPPEQ